MSLELVPLCGIDVTLAEPLRVGAGPSGQRTVAEITGMTFTGRLTGTLKGQAAADWITMVGDVATIDVRATIETHDAALVYVQYSGRTDISAGMGSAPMYVTPRFETGHPDYAWLNAVQAVGKGSLADLHYDWYEVR